MRPPIRYPQLIVKEIQQPASGIRVVTLTDEDDWPLPPFRIGAHIDLHLSNGMVRTYSICNEPSDASRYVIAVKLEPNGRGGSSYIHNSLSVGQKVNVSLPRAGLDDSSAMHVYIAGGIGVTPFLSAIRELEKRGATNYFLHWVSEGEPALLSWIQTPYESGRVKIYDTSKEPIPNIAEMVSVYDPDVHLSCCGPAGMLADFERAVQGRDPASVHIERFVPIPQMAALSHSPYKVVLALSNKEIYVQSHQTLLASLQENEVGIPVSCEGGLCGACKVRWLEGTPIHRDTCLTPNERNEYMMVCVGGCSSERLILDL